MHNEPLTRTGAADARMRKPASHALVPVAASGRAENGRDGRTSQERVPFRRMLRQAGASAGFLTQLIACADNLPAYRARRRAEPEEAARVYAGSPKRPVARYGIAV